MFTTLSCFLRCWCFSFRIGRRLVLWSTSIGMYFFGIAAAFTLDYYSFMLTRFLLAIVSCVFFFNFFNWTQCFTSKLNSLRYANLESRARDQGLTLVHSLAEVLSVEYECPLFRMGLIKMNNCCLLGRNFFVWLYAWHRVHIPQFLGHYFISEQLIILVSSGPACMSQTDG